MLRTLLNLVIMRRICSYLSKSVTSPVSFEARIAAYMSGFVGIFGYEVGCEQKFNSGRFAGW
jgi:hypothetical protein